MPVVRKSRTTTYKKVPGQSKGRITKAVVANIAKRVVNKEIETKKRSQEVEETNISTLGGFHTSVGLLRLPAGSSHGQRNGHKVQPIGLDVRGHFHTPNPNQIYVKCMLIQVKNNTATLPADLLETNATNVDPATTDMTSMWRRVNTDSFRVLGTKMLYMSDITARSRMFKFWIPLKKHYALTYEGSAEVDPNYGRIYLVAWARGAGNDALSTNIELTYNSTFYYKDA
ncbi:hypothetical protein [Rheinheimera sp.]|uniref:hypothetical protein n=1 Tax=Rheinheimera sp. TaxID=1869214 RepID=UPI004048080D